MSRINFTTASSEDLKITLSNAIKVMSHIFWDEIAIPLYDDEFFSLNDDRTVTLEEIEQVIQVKPFKPSRSKFYSKCATALGYKNWNELVTVSDKNTDKEAMPLFVHQDKELLDAFIKVFESAFNEVFTVPIDHAFYPHYKEVVGQAVSLVAWALILNPNRGVANTKIEECITITSAKSEHYNGTSLAHIGYDSDNQCVALICNYEKLLPDIIKLPFGIALGNEVKHLVRGDGFLDQFHDIFTLNEHFELYSKEESNQMAGIFNLTCWVDWTGRERGSGYEEFRDIHLKAETRADLVEDIMSPWKK